MRQSPWHAVKAGWVGPAIMIMIMIMIVVAAVAPVASGRAHQPSKHHQVSKHAHPRPRASAPSGLASTRHIVVIYEENHSFDNLYGGWERVRGLGTANQARTRQVSQAGTPFTCLEQNDVNFSAPGPCKDTTTGSSFTSAFTNGPFSIDSVLPQTATTCPVPGAFAMHGVANGSGLSGGCTEDLVHRYYQEQYALDHGRQDRYVTGSDAVGLAMGHYNTRALPIYRYLHASGHPHYAIADNFFQGAFGGSFLNAQWLIAAATPTFVGAVNDGGASDLHSVVDTNGMPTSYPLYQSPAGAAIKDQQLTASCTPGSGRGPTPAGVKCGDFAVNTIQPAVQPYAPGTPASKRLPLLTQPTIGDRLSAAKVDWAWYSGGWSNADGEVGAPGWSNGTGALPANSTSAAPCPDPAADAKAVFPNCPDKLFQYHHQAFNYYVNYAPGTPARAVHLRDEREFLDRAGSSTTSCGLKAVSIVKPLGEENEHPGYSSESNGSDHLVTVLKAIEGGACAHNTMVIVTYDEFGGGWDPVTPPGQGGTLGPHDVWGPGTRVPALVVSPLVPASFRVDHRLHDTTSILSTIEHRYHLVPLSTRDAASKDLSSALGPKANAQRKRSSHRRRRSKAR